MDPVVRRGDKLKKLILVLAAAQGIGFEEILNELTRRNKIKK